METKYGEYIIKEQCGSGGCGKTLVVLLKGNKKAFILKTLIETKINRTNIKNLQNEIEILEELNKDPTCGKYIPILYAYDKTNYQDEEEKKANDNNNIIINENIKEEDNKIRERPYYVIDFFSKGNLLYYNYYGNFSEAHARVIFKKILEAIKFCHDKGICHLDIKPDNIMLDKDLQLILIDFGYAAKFLDKNNKRIEFTDGKGTKEYISPDMRVREKFDGEKCDIFSLGQVLFNLVTKAHGFKTSSPSDKSYSLIKKKDYKTYWEKKFLSGIRSDLSENFKNLYIKMVAFNPEERPTINEILKSPWLEEYNKLSKEEKEKLEEEVNAELLKIYDKIKDINSEIKSANRVKDEGYETRAIDDGDIIFSNNLTPKKISNDRININHHIIINGYLNAINFMNSLLNGIKNEFDEEVSIITSEESLKFKITFEDEVEEEENKDNIDQYGNTIMIVELFQYEDGRHLLEFLRTGGKLLDYHKKFLKIKEITQKLL